MASANTVVVALMLALVLIGVYFLESSSPGTKHGGRSPPAQIPSSALKLELDLNRDLYITLMMNSVLDAIYNYSPELEDGSLGPPSRKHFKSGRNLGIVGKRAFTMVGRRRLMNVRECLEEVILNNVPGDVVETGVWRGGTMMFAQAVLISYQQTDSRRVYLCDSFKGIPPVDLKKYPKDNAITFGSALQLDIDGGHMAVKDSFEKIGVLRENVKFVPGFFNETLHTLTEITQIALLRLDGDIYQSTMEALTHLYPKLQVGGYVIIDDYPSWESCVQAVHDYREQHNITEPILKVKHLPGQQVHGAYWQKVRHRSS